jgi:hypothetical protein
MLILETHAPIAYRAQRFVDFDWRRHLPRFSHIF